MNVTLHEAANQAGGRCRSYHDPAIDMVIDNGNHLVLSGNKSVLAYLDDIGARDRLIGPEHAVFPFVDLATNERWTLRPNDGVLPWWIFDPSRRVPNTGIAAIIWRWRASVERKAKDHRRRASIATARCING